MPEGARELPVPVACALTTGLRRILVELHPEIDEDIPEDADLFRAGLDSLKAVEFVLEIEQRYCVQFRFADITYERFKTLASVAALVRHSLLPSSDPERPSPERRFGADSP
jgi:acyl carrier protein